MFHTVKGVAEFQTINFDVIGQDIYQTKQRLGCQYFLFSCLFNAFFYESLLLVFRFMPNNKILLTVTVGMCDLKDWASLFSKEPGILKLSSFWKRHRFWWFIVTVTLILTRERNEDKCIWISRHDNTTECERNVLIILLRMNKWITNHSKPNP